MTTSQEGLPIEAEGLAVRIRGFVKRFGQTTAVDGLNLDVPFGKCIGLLGPNGAGKSTTMKALAGLVNANEGDLVVLGHQLPLHGKAARAGMGVVPQHDNLDAFLTVEQNLRVFAHLYRVPASSREAAINRALDLAKLQDRRGSQVDDLSGGMRRRLLIARALLHQPHLVLLDEPTVGLDPQLRHALWGLIDELRAEGVAILMSTHYVEEAERLCDSVTIMSGGKAVASGPPLELIREHAGAEAVEVFGPSLHLKSVEEHALERGWRTRRTGTSVTVLHAHGSPALEGIRRSTTLEDVVVLLTDEGLS
jgi:lipooligosaccharide transport system ATP-binding protein